MQRRYQRRKKDSDVTVTYALRGWKPLLCIEHARWLGLLNHGSNPRD